MSINSIKGAPRKLRVLHCPTITGGNPPAMAKIERQAGLTSECVVLDGNGFGYEGATTYRADGIHRVLLEFRRFALFFRAAFSFDVIHYNFGSCIFPQPKLGPRAGGERPLKRLGRWAFNLYARLFAYKDVTLLRALGKKIVVTFQGDDVRDWLYCRENHAITPMIEVEPVYANHERDAAARRRGALFAKNAHLIYAVNPDLFAVLPERAKFLTYAHPNITEWTYVGVDAASERPITVFHAPTFREGKGTRFVEQAVRELREEGLNFDFKLLEGLPNHEVRKIYSEGDILVDQLLTGWFGCLSVECMALGKVVPPLWWRIWRFSGRIRAPSKTHFAALFPWEDQNWLSLGLSPGSLWKHTIIRKIWENG
jgi:hypothetical protein